MGGPDPAVAAVRAAVRRALADLEPDRPVVVALSGGADSLALMAATGFERPGCAAAVVVDHGWSEGSARVAAAAAALAGELGAARSEVVTLAPHRRSEDAARTLRYDALRSAAQRVGASAVLLGHTRDDQAETVLLGLARGSGSRSLSAMAPVRGRWRRPLLGLERRQTAAACRALGLSPWQDPANQDSRYTRARVRDRVLPVLEAEIGPGIGAALARTARLLRDDADALDALAAAAVPGVLVDPGAGDPAGEVRLDCGALAALPAAVRRRVLLSLTPARTLAHAEALDLLVTAWHGQGAVALPGGVRAVREHGRIRLVSERTG